MVGTPRLHRPSICCLASFLDKHFTGTGMVRHLTLTALEIQRDQTVGGADSNSFNFLTRRSGIGVTE